MGLLRILVYRFLFVTLGNKRRSLVNVKRFIKHDKHRIYTLDPNPKPVRLDGKELTKSNS